MHDVGPMRVVERIRDLARNARRGIDRQLAFLAQTVPKGLSLHHRHDEVEEPVGLSGIVEREDVWMRQLCGESDLPQKALSA